MNSEVVARLRWIELYEECKDAGLVCRRCGISRPTLRKWWKRYKDHGLEGLNSQSRKPKTSPKTKVGKKETEWILDLRKRRKLGARRLQAELKRLHNYSLSAAKIHKVLSKYECKPLNKPRRKKEYKLRYSPVSLAIESKWIPLNAYRDFYRSF